MDELLGAPIPAETTATCDDCAMVVPDTAAGDAGYNPATKCCTFVPDLWNFLVGGVLLDEHGDAGKGRASVEARIDRGVAVTPIGLGKSATYSVIYQSSENAFGHSRAMLCPHYLDEAGGLCGVWRHRESTCTTWFCKFVRGAVGQGFWSELHQLLRVAEESVAAWCLLELGVDSAVLARLFRPRRGGGRESVSVTWQDVDGASDAADQRVVWGEWRGREREFYVECARLVARLAWADVMRIGGAQLTVHARLTRDAFSRLTDYSIPAHPVTALVKITPRGPTRARLATYSSSDVLEVPSVVADVLSFLDGRATAEALDEIRRERGVILEPSLVRKLTDFGVLRDAAR